MYSEYKILFWPYLTLEITIALTLQDVFKVLGLYVQQLYSTANQINNVINSFNLSIYKKITLIKSRSVHILFKVL